MERALLSQTVAFFLINPIPAVLCEFVREKERAYQLQLTHFVSNMHNF
jgi:hypothetical protein